MKRSEIEQVISEFVAMTNPSGVSFNQNQLKEYVDKICEKIKVDGEYDEYALFLTEQEVKRVALNNATRDTILKLVKAEKNHEINIESSNVYITTTNLGTEEPSVHRLSTVFVEKGYGNVLFVTTTDGLTKNIYSINVRLEDILSAILDVKIFNRDKQ